MNNLANCAAECRSIQVKRKYNDIYFTLFKYYFYHFAEKNKIVRAYFLKNADSYEKSMGIGFRLNTTAEEEKLRHKVFSDTDVNEIIRISEEPRNEIPKFTPQIDKRFKPKLSYLPEILEIRRQKQK